ncbi:hypothetical protein [Tuwongella immobilis]|uniref:Uncharacterized protein n=1 Tax=Tuwongella immobilis TaxID=692036 RepID=A0A6C2YIH5_9BACT|nr:hypothetical protein [Tuwongella immobilis]VIP01217.1 Uncharacterized protein OS=Herpetosiphon aurantiacus (strain ATCC 23779 / DSM 785) GN=Haur_1971 PE=4 SV=1 [Tuwongella immobilis]VTR97860.1 Uncharacterized protein OS=Herpetosiphon aurantiacus (strain ATCC 23779 / DSM 785) GN=Haur_1971 PE=4 SV=1 [Tuwongella immobilis]
MELSSRWDVPSPILFNRWKHHAGVLRAAIAWAAEQGPSGCQTLAETLVVVGNDLMDCYTGDEPPASIAVSVFESLRDAAVHQPERFAEWIDANGGYRLLDLPDGSRWTLRHGRHDARYVHLHPGRWSPQTVRIRANVLKTAVMAWAQTLAMGQTEPDLGSINQVRSRYFQLAPVESVRPDEGLGIALELFAPRNVLA